MIARIRDPKERRVSPSLLRARRLVAKTLLPLDGKTVRRNRAIARALWAAAGLGVFALAAYLAWRYGLWSRGM
jgi:hypothetical protein